MPRPKKPGWEPITIAVSGEVARALRVLHSFSKREMGTVADEFMLKGGLLESAEYVLGKGGIPYPFRQPSQAPPAPAKPAAPSQAAPAAAIKPAPAAKPAPGEKRTRKGRFGEGDPELFQRCEAAIAAGKITQGALMEKVAPNVSTASYRSGWRVKGHVPAQYIAAVQAVLAGLEKDLAQD
jgi:hypothetical protein